MMESITTGRITGAILLSLLGIGLLTPELIANPTTKYMVLKVTSHEGKIFHKAIDYKKKDAFRKKAMEDYLKAKKLYEEEKKAFSKKHGSTKFTMPQPQRPSFKVAKRGLASYRDAIKAAYELDKKLKQEKEESKGKSTDSKKSRE